MESTIITLDATTETYWDIRNLIFDTVWKFQQQYGGDFDEMVAESNLIYMKCFISYNPDKSQFSTWLCKKIRGGLFDRFIRKENKYRMEKHFEDSEWYQIQAPVRSTFLKLLNELSDDTKTIIDLLMEPTNDLQTALLKKKTVRYNRKQALKIYLTSVLGWTNRRVKESFQEIVEVLNDH